MENIAYVCYVRVHKLFFFLRKKKTTQIALYIFFSGQYYCFDENT